MRFALLIVLLLGACTTPGKDLPTVKSSDPTWALVPDHITPADLPR